MTMFSGLLAVCFGHLVLPGGELDWSCEAGGYQHHADLNKYEGSAGETNLSEPHISLTLTSGRAQAAVPGGQWSCQAEGKPGAGLESSGGN